MKYAYSIIILLDVSITRRFRFRCLLDVSITRRFRYLTITRCFHYSAIPVLGNYSTFPVLDVSITRRFTVTYWWFDNRGLVEFAFHQQILQFNLNVFGHLIFGIKWIELRLMYKLFAILKYLRLGLAHFRYRVAFALRLEEYLSVPPYVFVNEYIITDKRTDNMYSTCTRVKVTSSTEYYMSAWTSFGNFDGRAQMCAFYGSRR